MLRPRIIPCLLIQDGGLVKTVKFGDAKYVGDPINAVRIFNEKEADELIVLDIDATAKNLDPDYSRIANLAAECRMPLCYGGGIKTVEQARKIVQLGVEKLAMSSVALSNPKVLSAMASEVGGQSVVVVLDIKRRTFSSKYDVWTHNATINTKRDVFEVIEEVQDLGIGEIVVNFIDHDGKMAGYPLDLVQKLKAVTIVPFTVLGGAGSLNDLGEVVSKCGIIGVAAGSLFVFKGKYRAVLISYPTHEQKQHSVYGRV